MILAGDVGGTHTRLALFEVESGKFVSRVEEIYPSRQSKSLEEIIDIFLKAHPAKLDCAAIGIAGPIRNGRCVATNLPWVVDVKVITSRIGIANVALLNDLEANAYGIATLLPEDFAIIYPGAANAEGNIGVVSAGTGLGKAGMYFDGTDHHPFATEGGHSSFSPENELEAELYEFLASRYGHVSWERVLSGPGLVNIFEFLRDEKGAEVPRDLAEAMKTGDAAAAISKAAIAGAPEICVKALDMFVRAYGAECGNFGLNILASGGIYLGGGIPPRILPKLRDGAFVEAFLAKGRMRPLLEAIPVRVILNDNAALRGAARGAWLHFGKAKRAA